MGDADGDGLGEGLGIGDGLGDGDGLGLGDGDGETLGVGDGLADDPGVGGLLRFCGSLVISWKSLKLSPESCVLPEDPPGLRS